MKFVVGENGRNPKKNLPRPRFVHHENPHGVVEMPTRDPSGGRQAPNRLRHEAAACIDYMLKIVKLRLQYYLKNTRLVWVAHWQRPCQWAQGSRVQTRLTPLYFKMLKFFKHPPHI